MTLIPVILLLGMLLGLSCATTGGAQEPEFVPIIFVHGGAGSGAQYQSQAMRFASNGYPADHIRVFDYDSSNPAPEIVQPALDAFIDGVLTELNADQAYMLGHSLGTRVMQEYLNSSSERAARVAKYINIDGGTADSPPGGVPTLAIWGMGSPEREIVGAENVYFPDQTHTQSVTSPESFAAQYEFFTGEPPATSDIEPEADIKLAGRAVLFPQNVGIEGATLEIWEVAALTGARTGSEPEATYNLGADGAWGPFAADGTQHYEMVLIREEGTHDHHLYFQPFIRSNYLIRLLSVSPESPIVLNAEGSERHSAATIIRYKEWWGDDPGDNNDVLEINGTNVINAATSPISNRTIGIHAFDKGSDGVTDLREPDAFYIALPFQTGMDIYIPAAPPEGAICFANAPRGDESKMQVVNVPNWPSSEHRISVEFTDYVREGDPECGVAAAPEPTPQLQLPDTGSGPAPDAGVLPYAVAIVLALSALALAAAHVRPRL
jgi:pimeloyl-ACP methyl ester carboxylesterase